MPIGAWILFAFFTLIIGIFAIAIIIDSTNKAVAIITAIVAILLIFAILFGLFWFYNNTAKGQRAMIDQKSSLGQGLERTVVVYTANGDIIAEYTGMIDIEANDGGYIKFDFEGKRYMYYNCFVESIAEIG